MRRVGVVVTALLTLAVETAAQRKVLDLQEVGSFDVRGGEIVDWSLSADGRVLCTTGEHGDLLVRDGSTLEPRRRFEVHATARVHPGGRFAAISTRPSQKGEQATLRILNLQTGASESISDGPLAFEWSGDGAVLMWISSTRDEARTLHTRRVSLGEHAAVLSDAQEVELLSRRHQTLVVGTDGSECWISGSSDGYAVHEEHVHVSLRSPSPQQELRRGIVLGTDLRGEPIIAMRTSLRLAGRNYETGAQRPRWAASSDRRRLALLDDADRTVLHVAVNGEELQPLRLPTRGDIHRLRFGPEGRLFVSDDSGQLHVFHDRQHRSISGHKGKPERVLWSVDGRYLAARGRGESVIATYKGEIVRRFDGPRLLAQDEYSGRFVHAESSGVRVFDARRKEFVAHWKPPSGFDFDTADSPWSNTWLFNAEFHAIPMIAFDRGMRLVAIANAHEGQASGPFFVNKSGIRSIDASRPQGAYWRIEPLRVLRRPNTTEVAMLEATPPEMCGNGRFGSKFFGALRVFDVDGTLVHQQHFEQSPSAGAYSPDGRILAIARAEQIAILGADDFKLQRSCELDHSLDWLGFLSNTTLLGVTDRRLFLWDVASLERLQEVDLPLPANIKISALDIASEPGRLAVGAGQRVHLFELR